MAHLWQIATRCGVDARPGLPEEDGQRTETSCACTAFTCGSVSYPACEAVCREPKRAFCVQGTCSGPAGFESASPNECRCQ